MILAARRRELISYPPPHTSYPVPPTLEERLSKKLLFHPLTWQKQAIFRVSSQFALSGVHQQKKQNLIRWWKAGLPVTNISPPPQCQQGSEWISLHLHLALMRLNKVLQVEPDTDSTICNSWCQLEPVENWTSTSTWHQPSYSSWDNKGVRVSPLLTFAWLPQDSARTCFYDTPLVPTGRKQREVQVSFPPSVGKRGAEFPNHPLQQDGRNQWA